MDNALKEIEMTEEEKQFSRSYAESCQSYEDSVEGYYD